MVTGPLAESSLFLLDACLSAWTSRGFRYVSLPWVVPTRYTDVTRPPGATDVLTPHGALVASGEQAFLQLWDEAHLPPSRLGYIGWTPCFRDEPVLDDLHHHAFIKAELFIPLEAACLAELDALEGPSQRLLARLVEQQAEVFRLLASREGRRGIPLVQERVDGRQTDLLLAGIELGSYGLRCFKDRAYLYGTALALPRFHVALEQWARVGG